jgi:hypothetical protein
MVRNRIFCLILIVVTFAAMAGCQTATPTLPTTHTQTPGQSTPVATHGLNVAAIPATSTRAAPTTLPSSTPLPGPTSLPTLASTGSIALPGVQVSSLAISADAVYWVSKSEPGLIYRRALSAQNSTPDPLVKSRFITGNMAAMPIQVHGDWLVFMDQAFNATNPVWRLRAYNLVTKEDRLLDQAGGNRLANIYSFSADENLVAWIVQDHVPNRTCIEESALSLADLTTKRTREIIHSCATSDKQWNAVQVANGRILASVTLINEQNRSQVNLWESADTAPRPLSDAYPTDIPSYPALGPDWAVWQSNIGQTRITRLAGGAASVLSSPLDGDQLAGPLISQNWVIWLPTPDLVAYDLENSTWQVVATPAHTETIGQVAIGGGWVAWSIENSSGSAPSTRIEWANLK